jgi:sugar/nucleoside kinase (ribokinase family)
LTGTDDPEGQRERLRGKYPLVVIKRGAAGAEAFTESALWREASPPVRALDATGAGDAFAAAFVAGRLKGDNVEACLRQAVAAGAAATGFVGGRPV